MEARLVKWEKKSRPFPKAYKDGKKKPIKCELINMVKI
jgi:hypothetical protein